MTRLLMIVALFALASAGGAAQKATKPLAASNTTARPTAVTAAPLPAKDTGNKVLIVREVYQYDGDGRRDPFISLLTTSALRPLLNDLRLVPIAYDPRGQTSVAVLRNLTSKTQYKVRVGQTIGRMRVAAIQEKAVIFTIEEFGYSRQEILPFFCHSTKMRPGQLAF